MLRTPWPANLGTSPAVAWPCGERNACRSAVMSSQSRGRVTIPRPITFNSVHRPYQLVQVWPGPQPQADRGWENERPYVTGLHRWWHLRTPSPELLEAEAAGML